MILFLLVKRMSEFIDTELCALELLISTKDLETIELKKEVLRLEFRGMSDEQKHRFRKLNTTIRQLKRDIEYEKPIEIHPPEIETSNDLIKHGRQVMDASTASLERTISIVNDTKKIGTAVAADLQKQTEQINEMYDDLYKIDDQVARSKKILARMTRRILSNKILWVL